MDGHTPEYLLAYEEWRGGMDAEKERLNKMKCYHTLNL